MGENINDRFNGAMSVNSILEIMRQKAPFQVTLLSDEDSPCVVSNWVSTGCVVLDAILGGGLPVGRITEIYGDTSTGKSLVAAQVCAEVQVGGGLAVMIDTESAVSLPIMEAVGVDTKSLIYSAPDTVEEVFSAMELALDSKAKVAKDSMMLIVWDSIAATSARAEMEADVGKPTMAVHARLISQGLRRLTRRISKENVCVLLLNQTRQKIGVLFGDNVTTFGGKAVGFHSSIRVMLSVIGKIKEHGKVVGIETKAVVKKNKVAPPFREATLPIYFGYGIDDALAAYYFLKNAGVISGKGWNVLDIDGEEIRFQKSGWADVFDMHYDAIVELVNAAV